MINHGKRLPSIFDIQYITNSHGYRFNWWSRWPELINCQEGQTAKKGKQPRFLLDKVIHSNTCDRNEIVKGKCLFSHGGNCRQKWELTVLRVALYQIVLFIASYPAMLNISHPRCGLTLFIYRIKPSRECVIGIYIHKFTSDRNEKLNAARGEALQYLLLWPKPCFQLWWGMILGDIETNNSIIMILFPFPMSISNQSIDNRNFIQNETLVLYSRLSCYTVDFRV